MSTGAFLICDTKRTAYMLGKFLGTWAPVDWTETDEATFRARVVDAWLCDRPGARRATAQAYATALAAVLFRFCVDHGWAVRIVDEDFFIDEAQLDVNGTDPDMPVFALLGSRWPNDPPLGRGYDLSASRASAREGTPPARR